MRQWQQLLLLCLAGIVVPLPYGDCATIQAQFEKIPATLGCSSITSTVVAASKIECATRSSLADIWRSFSYIDGVCVLSSIGNCAALGATSVFKRQMEELPAFVPSVGYNATVGARRFWVFQQRKTGLVSFARNWTEYEQGFGDANDFWSGLATIQSFTSSAARILRIEMITFDGALYVAEWSNFTVSSASTNYTMNYGSYLSGSSNTSASCNTLLFHRNMKFSTIDRDNDLSNWHCSQNWGGAGFWFNNCLYINLNGLYSATNQSGSMHYMSSMCVQNYKTLRDARMMLLQI